MKKAEPAVAVDGAGIVVFFVTIYLIMLNVKRRHFRIGNRLAGIAVILILTFAIVFNVSKLPYAMWFKVVMLGCFPAACYLGGMRGVQMSSPAADSNTE